MKTGESLAADKRIMGYDEHQSAMTINRRVGIGIKAVALCEASVSIAELATGNIKTGVFAGIGTMACAGAGWLNNKLRDFGKNLPHLPPDQLTVNYER